MCQNVCMSCPLLQSPALLPLLFLLEPEALQALEVWTPEDSVLPSANLAFPARDSQAPNQFSH